MKECIYSRHVEAKRLYNQRLKAAQEPKDWQHYVCCKFLRLCTSEPQGPTINVGISSCFSGGKGKRKALPYI